MLDKIDLRQKISKADYEQVFPGLVARLGECQRAARVAGMGVVLVFEGWDAAGKGTVINELAQALDPRGFKVHPISKPDRGEKLRPWMWRFWNALPEGGSIAIFDRSWYGRVLVERVEGLCEEPVWQRAFQEINELEEDYLQQGGGLVKFWLEIDQEEQLKRFTAREADPHKQWKMTSEDWRNREKWDLYRQAIDEMLNRTGTRDAPWTVVESNDKYYSRIKTLRTVISSIEELL